MFAAPAIVTVPPSSEAAVANTPSARKHCPEGQIARQLVRRAAMRTSGGQRRNIPTPATLTRRLQCLVVRPTQPAVRGPSQLAIPRPAHHRIVRRGLGLAELAPGLRTEPNRRSPRQPPRRPDRRSFPRRRKTAGRSVPDPAVAYQGKVWVHPGRVMAMISYPCLLHFQDLPNRH